MSERLQSITSQYVRQSDGTVALPKPNESYETDGAPISQQNRTSPDAATIESADVVGRPSSTTPAKSTPNPEDNTTIKGYLEDGFLAPASESPTNGGSELTLNELRSLRVTTPPAELAPKQLVEAITLMFPAGVRGEALAVSWCESSWGTDPAAFAAEAEDAGWMQINRFWHEERALSHGWKWDQVRLDIQINFAMAVEIWSEFGWSAWTCKKILMSAESTMSVV